MPLRSRTIRVSDRAWEIFAEEASREGISANAWVVEAALGRAVFARTVRGDQEMMDWARVEDFLRDICRDP